PPAINRAERGAPLRRDDPEVRGAGAGLVARLVGRVDREPVAAQAQPAPLRQAALELDLVDPRVGVEGEAAGCRVPRTAWLGAVRALRRDALLVDPATGLGLGKGQLHARRLGEREPDGGADRRELRKLRERGAPPPTAGR